MTQTQFYKLYPVNPDSKEQRLVLDLRDGDLSWEQIAQVFLALSLSPYSEDWAIKTVDFQSI